jgi:hypothetical protein
MNKYQELKEKHQEEFNNFPMFFAFSNKQFEEGMKKAGLKLTDTDKIYKLGNTGGFYKKTDSAAFEEMNSRHNKAMNDAIESDTTGEGFIYDMFRYELSNHEYIITWDLEPTLDALCLTADEVNASEKLLHGLRKAKEDYIKNCD